jgi:hypothetical protein
MSHLCSSRTIAFAVAAAWTLAACGGDDAPGTLPQLGAATGATLVSCSDLTTKLTFANTTFTAASAVAAGGLKVGGNAIPSHCVVTGKMFDRVSTVDGKSYAIGFEMRLPDTWNGRFFYQANGGTDGSVSTANGTFGGGPVTSALAQGFAVLSSDAGHNAAQNPTFGIDPQARLDYGYQAVGKLTPMAKSVIQTAYGKAADRSYFGGCSNGGRHTMVTFARLFLVPGMTHCSAGPATDQFDMLTPIVNWVEKGQAPDSVLASARGASNPGGASADIPASWSPTRTRPLCSYPKVATYNGSGSIELAGSFSCK